MAAYARARSRAAVLIRLHHDGDFRRDELARSHSFPRESRVLGRREVRMGPEGALRRQVQHLGSERGGAALVARHGRIGRVEPVEERSHGRQRLVVPARRLGMADADAEQEAVRERARELRVLRGDVRRLVLPHVEDPRGDRERRWSARGTAGPAPGRDFRRARGRRTRGPRSPRPRRGRPDGGARCRSCRSPWLQRAMPAATHGCDVGRLPSPPVRPSAPRTHQQAVRDRTGWLAVEPIYGPG